MAKLAIKGHATLGKEVIKILEMMGGINELALNGTQIDSYYYIDNIDSKIHLGLSIYPYDYTIYTLEEFLEKFPYKVGDKVCFPDDLSTPFTINKMWWDENANELLCSFIEDDIEVPVVGIRTYKEETMKQIKIDIPKGYEFFGIDDDNKIVLAEKQPQYPKTYKECFNICFGNKHHIVQVLGLDGLGGNKDLFERFIKLKICRDAYCKIAGEQMGLGKSWKQDYDNRSFIIANNNGNIHTYVYYGNNNIILAFPTAEMRNTFYENFKDLIERCKELL